MFSTAPRDLLHGTDRAFLTKMLTETKLDLTFSSDSEKFGDVDILSLGLVLDARNSSWLAFGMVFLDF